MTKRVWTEIICDCCGCSDHQAGRIANHDIHFYGWIEHKKKYFCSEKCKNEYYQPVTPWAH